jgi:hypothetical protein
MAVAVAPSFIAFGFLVWSRPDAHPVLATVASLLLTFSALVMGAKVWDRQPESAGYSFADLMLWHWMRREWAEEKLVRNARMLGYDRNGRFVGKSKISPERQLQAAREIGSALDSKSSYTINHAKRVEAHTRDIAAMLQLSEKQVEELATAAALHDIGNLRVPEHVARKTSKLTLEERSTIEGHVLLGAIMAFDAVGDGVVQGLRHHHEHWDGGGYPSGLKGEEIPLYARIIGIAEAYDAMTSTRPYRQSLTRDQAVAVLRSESGSQFDAELVEVFVTTLPDPLEIVERFPVLAWAERQIRELTILFRRVGGVALSAAASTIAIALILGTAVLKPDAFGGREDAPAIRPERRMANHSPATNAATVLAKDVTLAAAVEEGVVDAIAMTAAPAVAEPSARTMAVEVLGERISIEAGHQGSGSVTDPVDNGNHGSNGNGGSDRPGEVVENPQPGNGGGTPGGGGGNDGGDPTPDPTDTPPGGGSTNPPPDTTPGNGNGNGNGHGNGNGGGNGHGNGGGNGHGNGGSNGNDRGNSASSPGHNKDDVIAGPGRGNSDDAPGHDKGDKDHGKGPTADDGIAPTPGPSPSGGNGNGNANGNNGNGNSDAVDSGTSDDSSPGNSGDAPGHADDSGDSDAPGNSDSSAGDDAGRPADPDGDSSPGNSGDAPGHSDDAGSDSGSGDSGSSDSGPGNSDNANGHSEDKGKGKDTGGGTTE